MLLPRSIDVLSEDNNSYARHGMANINLNILIIQI